MSLLTNDDWGDSFGTLPAVRLLWGWKQLENADVLGVFQHVQQQRSVLIKRSFILSSRA